MGKIRKNDGLNKWQRYRLKDVDAYRELKNKYAKTPEERKKRTEYMRDWRNKNRERHNQLARESHNRNRHKHVLNNKNKRLIRIYGITQEQKNKMEAYQNNCCLICGSNKENISRKTFHVDHCHNTGRVRGLLCSRCNGSLGWYEKYKESIIKYL